MTTLLAALLALQTPPVDGVKPMPWKDPGFAKILRVDSPNHNRRPDIDLVDTVVVHSTVIPTLELTTEAFLRVKSQVSAHFTIGKDGSIVQNVSTFERAWHAGVSEDHRKVSNLNNISIGIELVNLNDGKDPYPKAQVDALRLVILSLKRRFNLKYLTSHEAIARPLGRKSDPKNFPWKELGDLGLERHTDVSILSTEAKQG